MKRDDAKQLVAQGIAQLNDALAAGQSETLQRYLAVMGRFHRYSFGNVMLILMAKEDATHVAGFHKWKELGRQVRKGEKGIPILAPCRYKRKAGDKQGDDDEAEDVQLIFVTIDPARDTAERLGQYVRHFDERFVGVTGTDEEIGSVATLYGIYYRAGRGRKPRVTSWNIRPLCWLSTGTGT